MSVLLWNIRVPGTAASVEYLQIMVRKRKPFMVGILEPEQSISKMAELATTMGFSNYSHRYPSNNHIWFFWIINMNVFNIQSHPQMISFYVRYQEEQTIRISFVYAKCQRLERVGLWNNIKNNAQQSMPWINGGDFNTILSRRKNRVVWIQILEVCLILKIVVWIQI